MKTIVTLVLALVASSIVSAVVSDNAATRAQTEQGIYIARQSTVNGVNINQWYGIPYAQQPIGELRWKPPRPLAASKAVHEAYFPNACPQGESGAVAPFTEACLSLNVYAPVEASNLPVYVWIHGGSFTSGAGFFYDATQLVSTSEIGSVPVVVVTINYRLGLLGFLADEALYEERSGSHSRSTTGNYGILDQMMALDWIKQNIGSFGGNPEQITVGGESAGGISVTILLTSPLVANGTFQRAIIQSGGFWPSGVSPLPEAIEKTGDVLRASLSCTTLECLRSLTVDQILAVQAIIASKSIFGVSASPVVDGYVLNDTMERNYVKGAFQKVPILIGSNTNETSLFTCPYFHESASAAQVQSFFNTVYSATAVREIAAVYGPIATYANPLAYLNIVYSDSWLHCGSRRIASIFSRHGVPSYLYTYNHLIAVGSPCYGVAHAVELPMLFPLLLPIFYPGYIFTPAEERLSASMMLYWANFIYKANPNFAEEPANWDPYLASSDNDFVLDIDPEVRNHYYKATCSGLWDRYATSNVTSRS